VCMCVVSIAREAMIAINVVCNQPSFSGMFMWISQVREKR